jgi:PPOX class probable F420-dependent enzyme
VPITYVLDGDVVFTVVDSKPKRSRRLKRLQNIASRPDVAVLVDEYSDDWTQLWWCRLDGRARIVDAGADFDAGLQALSDKYPQYRDDPPAGPLIVVEVERVSGWSATNEGRR